MLNPIDDPNRWARDIKNDWLVTDKLQLGAYDPESAKWKSSTAMNFHSGDFVDVGLRFDIVERLSKNGTERFRYEVRLSLLHMAQIYKATDVPYVWLVFSFLATSTDF